MQEKDTDISKGTLPIEIAFDETIDTPFRAIKQDNGWQLQVNRGYFENRGFTDAEVEGACALEGKRAMRQISLDTREAISGLRRWRSLGQTDSQVQAFQTLFERLAALKALEKHDPERAELARGFLTKFCANGGQSYPEQLFGGILSEEVKGDTQVEPVVGRVINSLGREETIEGRTVSPIDALESPSLSFEAKTAWLENRFMPWLEFLKNQQAAKPQEQPSETQEQSETRPDQEPPTPPPATDEYEQHRGREEKQEGAPPIFKVEPFQGGYFEQDSYDVVDETSGRLSKSQTQAVQGQQIPTKNSPEEANNPHRTVSGSSGTDLFALPLVANHQLTDSGLTKLKSLGIDVFADQEGHVFLKSVTNQAYEAQIAKNSESHSKGIISQDTKIVETVPQEIERELERIRNLTSTTKEKAIAWRDFVHNFFTYPQDDQVEGMYRSVDSQSSNRLQAMVSGKLADCYLAREFFIAGLKRLNLNDLEWRNVNGYFVSGRAKDGTAHLHSGNAHAWAKARQKGDTEWLVLDPTPKGDPIKEKGDEQSESGENQMENFQDFSPELLSEDDLAELEKEADERDSPEKRLSLEEKWLQEFSDQTGLPLEEVRKIKEMLEQVDELKDAEGRNILKRIKEQIDKIIQNYINEERRMVGMTRMSQGQALEDPVAARLDVKSGILDPTGFIKEETVVEKEKVYGGFDLHLVIDGSGSMAETVGGKVKYKEQQKMVYLILRAAHYFSQEAQKRRLRLITPLKVRSEVVLFQADRVEVVKPLSDEFTPVQMALLWKRLGENIGGGTPDHLGLQQVANDISEEESQLLERKKLLKIVSLVRDGGSDDPAKVRALVDKLKSMNVIVGDFLITNANSLNKLPQDIAGQVIDAIAHLMPERVDRRR